MTAFVYCRGCAHQIHESAPVCPKCGAPQFGAAAGSTPKSTPVPATPTADTLPQKWITIFSLIEKARGPTLPDKANLSRPERRKVTWNFWAAGFSALYYFVKGMWKKGLTLLMISIGCNIVAELVFSIIGLSRSSPNLATTAALIAIAFIAGRRANVDYYRKVWKLTRLNPSTLKMEGLPLQLFHARHL
jgi:hypothetical protein